MDPRSELRLALTRRALLTRGALGLGGLALTSLLNGGVSAASRIAPRAKRVIFLFMSGGPSHLDLFDPKPKLAELHGREMPASLTKGERLSANAQRQGLLL